MFPQAGLNAFNLMSADDKRKNITSLVSVVLGIRLFNREIKKGGAGFIDSARALRLQAQHTSNMCDCLLQFRRW